ncbi:hypothetical protein J6590_046004 [Homalodisca vitripennis]|nr:hypothetical protein J6590_046004 [Homalodisca vitripennis]
MKKNIGGQHPLSHHPSSSDLDIQEPESVIRSSFRPCRFRSVHHPAHEFCLWNKECSTSFQCVWNNCLKVGRPREI